MPAADSFSRPVSSEPATKTAFLVVDTESVPDGQLLAAVKYPDDNLAPEEAIARAQEEARALSKTGSDFLPVTFQIPVAVCVLRVGSDFGLASVFVSRCPSVSPARTHPAVLVRLLALCRFEGQAGDL